MGKACHLGWHNRPASSDHTAVDRDPRTGDNCWLGANVVILPGVELGNHVVVAAGTVVTKSFLQDDILLAGVPAKVTKELDAYGE